MVNNKPITMQIWDTAGQERFKSLVCKFIGVQMLVYWFTTSLAHRVSSD